MHYSVLTIIGLIKRSKDKIVDFYIANPNSQSLIFNPLLCSFEMKMRANWIHIPFSRWEHIYEHVCLYLCRTWPITCDEQHYWKCVRPPFFVCFQADRKTLKTLSQSLVSLSKYAISQYVHSYVRLIEASAALVDYLFLLLILLPWS